MQIARPLSIFSSILRFALGATVAVVAAGCAAPPPQKSSMELVAFDQAIHSATDALIRQTQGCNGFMGIGSGKRTLVLDPSLDAGSGQQTVATQYLDRAVAERISATAKDIEVVPFQAANLAKAQYVLAGTLLRAQGNYRLDLALVDLKDGKVAAQASALSRPEGVDMSPLAYYRDSPVLVKDEVIDGYVRTAATAAGQKGDAMYLDRIHTAVTINDATGLYNAARYREALAQYRRAQESPAGDQIRVLNGIYLTTLKLGQTAEAEEAFGRVVGYGIAHKQLGVKFLFNPGSTEFWSDPKVTSAYRMWLRQIARQGGSAKVCMDIVGHTSKTGTEGVNDALSLKRAVFIKQRLTTESAEVAERTRPKGMGSRQNLVGSGTDDVVDALDRRVEFAIVDCAK